MVSPEYMGLYMDIQRGIEDKGYEVIFVAQEHIPNNPYALVYGERDRMSVKSFQEYLFSFWNKMLDELSSESLWFDYLLVIDGLTFHSRLIERLREVNPNILAVNYLFDRVNGVYQIDHNFKFFDKVFSFDCSDSKEYRLHFLPIYWIPSESKEMRTQVFGFGAYDETRMVVFKRIKQLLVAENIDFYIKMYHPKVKNKVKYFLKYWIKRVLNKNNNLSLRELNSDLFTNSSIPTNDFRKWINSCNVVIDTNHPYQDGLTARFMWALGAGKRIITNNCHVKDYAFYTEEQILVLEDNTTDNQILSFVKGDLVIPQNIVAEIKKYRIDNWIETIFS